jgi:hypothetical protein
VRFHAQNWSTAQLFAENQRRAQRLQPDGSQQLVGLVLTSKAYLLLRPTIAVPGLAEQPCGLQLFAEVHVSAEQPPPDGHKTPQAQAPQSQRRRATPCATLTTKA